MTSRIHVVGKVVQGQIRCVTKPGVMSIRPLSNAGVKEVSAAVEIIEEVLKMKRVELDIPEFMKAHKKKKMGQLILFKPKGGAAEQEPEVEEEEVDRGEKIAEAMEDIFDHVGKKIKKFIKPVAKYFFDVYEEDEDNDQ